MTSRLQARMELAHGMWEEAVTIPVGEEWLKGNLIGGETTRPVGVLFLHGWGGVRSGPHGLLTYLARELARVGVPSLRFDFRGRGESLLSPEEISLGHMGDDAVAAGRYLLQRLGLRRLWLVGICSGGNVGIGVVNRLPETEGMFLLSVYPFGEADSFSRDARRSVHFVKVYWGKLWQASTWQRMVRGDISYRGVLRVLTNPFRKDRRRADATLEADASAAPAEAPARPSPLDNLLRKHIPIQITYGDADPDFLASKAYFDAFSRKHDYGMGLMTIPGANHNFYSLTWKKQLAVALQSLVEGTS